MRKTELLAALRGGAFDAKLRAVYGAELGAVYERIEAVVRGFCARFDPDGARDLAVFSAPGRTELGGNHTDHQNGCGIAAAVDMDTLGCAARREGTRIRVVSRGHDPVEVDVGDAAVRSGERSRSQALVRGIAAGMAAFGERVGGFDAYTETRVLRGSGLSSSAAFEVLVAQIMNHLFCGARFDALEIARLGQYAENVYYGKPCGLLDQLACAAGGVVAADFADAEHPAVARCAVDFAAAGYALVVIDSGANHSDLDGEFAAITEEMGAVARYFGAEKLGGVDEARFRAGYDAVRAAVGERPARRAAHFFDETKRARAQYEALSRGDFPGFLALVRESGASSETKLQNVTVDRPDGDRLLRVILRARALAGASGAARVHGGGFAGTAQAYVPLPALGGFVAAMEEEFGVGCCHLVRLRAAGGVRLL